MHDAWVAWVRSPAVQCWVYSDMVASPEKYHSLLIMKLKVLEHKIRGWVSHCTNDSTKKNPLPQHEAVQIISLLLETIKDQTAKMAQECHILYLLYLRLLDGKCSAVVKQITVSLSGLQLPSHNPLRIICATEQSIVSYTGKVRGGAW